MFKHLNCLVWSLLLLVCGFSVPAVAASDLGATPAQTGGYDGDGQAIAILDTGANVHHEFFAKVLTEACFSGSSVIGGGEVAAPLATITSYCDGGQPPCTDRDTGLPIPYSECGPGAGDPCTGYGVCWHGTHVAGIALGNSGSRYGTARGASLIPIQVFVGHSTEGLVAYDSDLIAAMEYVLDLSEEQGIAIAAVNMSLGGSDFSSTAACDASSPPFKEAIDNLRAAGIATVIAAGNGSRNDMLSLPGCISSATGVGATNDSDAIRGFSNRSSALAFYAPGSGIYSSTLGGNNAYGDDKLPRPGDPSYVYTGCPALVSTAPIPPWIRERMGPGGTSLAATISTMPPTSRSPTGGCRA